jgi:peptide/nickel transport system substrate-binding protein/oligopeptide transport system substrate-binding protein
MEHPNRKVLALASMLLLAFLLGGCGLPWPFPQPPLDPKSPDNEQILRPLDSGPNAGDVDSLDPAQIQFGFDYSLAQLIFPQLVTLDDHLQPIDWAADSHEISADGLTYTFHLHKGMVWSDGTPIDATTFAYSINRALDPCLGSGVSYYLLDLAGAKTFNSSTCPPGAIKSTATLIGTSIQTPDPLTLRLTLADPAGYFLSALTWPTSSAVPQALVERYTQPGKPGDLASSTWTQHLLDNGPFGGNLYLLTSWQHTQISPTGRGSLIFERNERFSGKKPLLRRVEYGLYRDVAVEWNDFTQGKGDVSPVLAPQLAAARAMRTITVQQTPMLTYWYVKPSWALAPFDDVRVRQAFSLALDRNALALQGNSSSQANRPPETIQAYHQPSIHLVPEGMPGYNPDLTDAVGRKGTDALTPDLAAARRVASAYAAESCGGDYAKCPPIIFPIYGHMSSGLTALGQAIIDQWTQAFPGWRIQATGYAGVEVKPQYSVEIDGWGADYPDPQDFLSLLWGTLATYNAGHVSVPQADALLLQAGEMGDQRARMPLYQEAGQLLVIQGAAIPLYQFLQPYAVRPRVSGWRIAPTGLTPLSVWLKVYITR